MYALKPLIDTNLTMINKNSCMYGMKNIHEICSGDDHASKFCNNVTDIPEQVINFLKVFFFIIYRLGICVYKTCLLTKAKQ